MHFRYHDGSLPKPHSFKGGLPRWTEAQAQTFARDREADSTAGAMREVLVEGVAAVSKLVGQRDCCGELKALGKTALVSIQNERLGLPLRVRFLWYVTSLIGMHGPSTEVRAKYAKLIRTMTSKFRRAAGNLGAAEELSAELDDIEKREEA